MRMFFGDNEPANYDGFFEALSQSQEFRRRQFDELSKMPLTAGNGYRRVLSLGTHCYTAFLLKYAGLRDGSYPFDWAFSSPGMVSHCLDDDFSTFLDSRFYEIVPLDKRPDGPPYNKFHHTLYRDQFGVQFVFNHYDMNDFSNQAYFHRCVNRLRGVFASSEHTLLIQIFRYSSNYKEDFMEVARSVDRKGDHVTLLSVCVQESVSDLLMPEITLADAVGRHKQYQFCATSTMRGTEFSETIDDLAMLRLIEAQGLDLPRIYFPMKTL